MLIILTIKKNISMSLLMSMLKIVCISCFKRSVRKKTTREKWKNINDLLISKTRKDIWSCCQNSINNTAFDTQLGKIFKKKEQTCCSYTRKNGVLLRPSKIDAGIRFLRFFFGIWRYWRRMWVLYRPYTMSHALMAKYARLL